MCSVVQCVSFGEVIERDDTVSIQCVAIQQGLLYCGWNFKATYGLYPHQTDFCYIPFDGKEIASVSQSGHTLSHTCVCNCVGSYLEDVADLSTLDDLLQSIRLIIHCLLCIESQKEDNHYTLIIASISDCLIELMEAILHGRACKGKSIPILFIGISLFHFND